VLAYYVLVTSIREQALAPLARTDAQRLLPEDTSRGPPASRGSGTSELLSGTRTDSGEGDSPPGRRPGELSTWIEESEADPPKLAVAVETSHCRRSALSSRQGIDGECVALESRHRSGPPFARRGRARIAGPSASRSLPRGHETGRRGGGRKRGARRRSSPRGAGLIGAALSGPFGGLVIGFVYGLSRAISVPVASIAVWLEAVNPTAVGLMPFGQRSLVRRASGLGLLLLGGRGVAADDP